MKPHGKMKILNEIVAETEEDGSIYVTVEVFFDDSRTLNVLLEHKDEDCPEYCYYSCATVDNENSLKLAAFRGVALTGLPALFRKKFGLEPGSAKISEAKEIFYDMLQYINLSGVEYSLEEEVPLS